jgi:hypothetical protein
VFQSLDVTFRKIKQWEGVSQLGGGLTDPEILSLNNTGLNSSLDSNANLNLIAIVACTIKMSHTSNDCLIDDLSHHLKSAKQMIDQNSPNIKPNLFIDFPCA